MFPSYRRHWLLAILAGVTLSMMALQPILAYTLQRNNFDATGAPQHPGVPNGCTNVDPWWCIEWPLASNGYSSTTYVYLYSSLNSRPTGETIDMKQQALNAFSRWNAVPARSPYLVSVPYSSQSSGSQDPYDCPTYIKRASLPLGYLGVTTDLTAANLLGAPASPKQIICSQMIVNSNQAFDADTDPGDGMADARFMFRHELGHVLGLGHTGHVAIMYPVWPNSYYMGATPTSDDILGLQFAYGAP